MAPTTIGHSRRSNIESIASLKLILLLRGSVFGKKRSPRQVKPLRRMSRSVLLDVLARVQFLLQPRRHTAATGPVQGGATPLGSILQIAAGALCSPSDSVRSVPPAPPPQSLGSPAATRGRPSRQVRGQHGWARHHGMPNFRRVRRQMWFGRAVRRCRGGGAPLVGTVFPNPKGDAGDLAKWGELWLQPLTPPRRELPAALVAVRSLAQRDGGPRMWGRYTAVGQLSC
jgi:hypothetical protein